VLADALRPLASQLRPEAVLISLAPKVTIAKLTETLGGFGRIARAIPNAASVVNAGFNPVTLSPALAGTERDGLLGWLGKLGDCPVVAEEQLEAYAVLTAMGPTYLWFQLDQMRKLGESFGLPPGAAGTALARMVAGAAKTFFESGLTPEEVMDLVPVKPLQEEEAGIRSAYQTRLEAMYRKLKG
jgi:pyrroline-5-carboxylate reductase